MPPFPPDLLISSPQQLSQALQVSNSRDPNGQPVVLPFHFDFVATAIHTVNLETMLQRGTIASLQTMYFDNSRNDKPVVISLSGTGQRLVIPIAACGYVPILLTNSGITLTFDGTGSTTGTDTFVGLLNVPMPGVVWFPYDAHTHG